MITDQEIENFLKDKPEYVKLIKRIINYENNNIKPDHSFIEDTEYDACWEAKDVKVKPQRIYQLEMKGIVERVFDSNSTTSYTLDDRDAISDLVSNIDISDDGEQKAIHEFPEEEDLPDDLFDDVVGYDKIKWLLKRSITTQQITNVLFVGPTGSAKTVFLMAIEEKLGEAMFMSGKPSSGPGVLDVMFRDTPKYMLIDEIDDMDGEVQRVLSQYMETGIVDETKVDKTRKLETNTKTFASANEMDGLIEQVQDRFLDLHFEAYDRDEYIEICKHILPRKEDTGEEEAGRIAELLWEAEEEGDVRKAIQVARHSRGDPEKVISILDDYSQKNTVLGL